MAVYGVLAVVGLGIIAATAWITASEYKNLPDRVPLQFWFDGRPTSFGPRPAVWLIVAVQVFCAAIFALTVISLTNAPGTHRHSMGMVLFGLCMLGLLANAQLMSIEAAKLPEPRLPIRRFWLSFAGFIALAVACAVLF